MKLRTYFAFVLLLAALMTGCDRGSKPNFVGSAAPDFAIQDANRTISLHDFRGKTVVLNFWATWCPPCLEEMPSLTAMQRQMKDRGVIVFAVSTDTDDIAYRNFIRDRKIDLLTIRDDKQTSNFLYGTFKFPETYIIDRNGVVRRKIVGPVDWTSPEMTEYLAGL